MRLMDNKYTESISRLFIYDISNSSDIFSGTSPYRKTLITLHNRGRCHIKADVTAMNGLLWSLLLSSSITAEHPTGDEQHG